MLGVYRPVHKKKSRTDSNNPLSNSYLDDVLIEEDVKAVNKLFGP